MATDERDRILRAQAGDTTAFGQIVAAHQTAVFNVAYRLLGHRHDAEDATQEAFLRAFAALNRFDVNRPFRPWIKQIVTNVCLNVLQSARSQRQLLATEMSRPGGDVVKMDDWQSKRVRFISIVNSAGTNPFETHPNKTPPNPPGRKRPGCEQTFSVEISFCGVSTKRFCASAVFSVQSVLSVTTSLIQSPYGRYRR